MKTNQPHCHTNTPFATIKQWIDHQQQKQFSKANLQKRLEKLIDEQTILNKQLLQM